MAIQIQQIAFLNEKGKRKNNEDNIMPLGGSAPTDTKLFLVCDGVGGANKGEVASLLVCQNFDAFFQQHPNRAVDAQYLHDALRYVEGKLSEYANEHSECAGMATTLTLLYLDDVDQRAVIAWCGDSRVYHIRDKEVLFVTSDHSLVNELVKRGEITAEEAHKHPQRNVILRAISGKETPTSIDIYETTDLRQHDYFVLCSDGILESIDERILTTLLPNTTINTEQKKDLIREMCDMNSNDNFSMYLIELGEVSQNSPQTPTKPIEPLNTAAVNKPASAPLDTTPISQIPPALDDNSAGSTKFVYLLVTAAILALGVLGFVQWKNNKAAEALTEQIQQAQMWNESGDLASLTRADSLLQVLQKYEHQDTRIADLLAQVQQKIEEQKGVAWRDSLRTYIQQKWYNADDSVAIKRAKYNLDILDSLVISKDSLQLKIAFAKMDSAIQRRNSIKASLQAPAKLAKPAKPVEKDSVP